MQRFEARAEKSGYIIPAKWRKRREEGSGDLLILRAQELLVRRDWKRLEAEEFGPLWVKPNGHGKITIDSGKPRPAKLSAYLIAVERTAQPLRVYAHKGKWEFYRSFTT